MAYGISKRTKRKIFFPTMLLFLFLLSFVALYFGIKFTAKYFASNRDYDPLILEASKKYCVDPYLIKAVIWRESNFNPDALGADGEVGLMQVIPDKAGQDWAIFNKIKLPPKGAFFNPKLNIDVGAWYLSKGLRKWKDYKHSTELALCSYNAGAKAASPWAPDSKDGNVLERIKYPSTKRYVIAILKKRNEYLKNGVFKNQEKQKK
jgi:soluble lytic murein transglycosylase